MTAKLYVGNIAYNVSGEDLSNLFSEAGKVIASRVIIDRVTGKSRGFGFVEMTNQADAEKAISIFNGYSLLSRTLLVYLAHDNRELSRQAREAKQNQQKKYLAANSVSEPQHQFYTQVANNKSV